MTRSATAGASPKSPPLAIGVAIANNSKNRRTLTLPMVMAVVDGQRYLVSMLGEHVEWVRILRAVATAPRIAVKACHASSKTFTAAEAVLWWVTRFPDGIVVTTAPTWIQVERLLWGEIHKAARSAVVAYPPFNRTDFRFGPNNYAGGVSTNDGVRDLVL